MIQKNVKWYVDENGTRFGKANADLDLAGEIRGDFGFIKDGAGQMELTGANSYTGPTSIAGGTHEAPPRAHLTILHSWPERVLKAAARGSQPPATSRRRNTR